MFKLSLRDVGLGLIVATAAPLFLALTAILGAVINAPGFDAWSVDYGALFHSLVNSAIVSSYGGFTGYIVKNFFTSGQGNLFGIGDN